MLLSIISITSGIIGYVCGHRAPHFEKHWCKHFSVGRESTEDDQRPGRLVTVSRVETVTKINQIVRADRRMSIPMTVEAVNADKETPPRDDDRFGVVAKILVFGSEGSQIESSFKFIDIMFNGCDPESSVTALFCETTSMAAKTKTMAVWNTDNIHAAVYKQLVGILIFLKRSHPRDNAKLSGTER
ncbi:hypothetical protein TNCV_592351 [Trichonephila clavipes]|nr:hypothetical protein TNCV_592351 [Trichonephila clavipes]